jgi:hypothetical protein
MARSMAINGLGAAVTAVTVLVVIVSKFAEGAWITVIAIPAMYVTFRAIRARHAWIAREIAENHTDWQPLAVRAAAPPIVLVPVTGLDRIACKALSFAVTISPDVEAVMVETGDERAGAGHVESLRGCWQQLIDDPVCGCGHRPIPFVTLPSAYREFYLPFLRYVRETAVRHPDRYIAVVVPEVLKRRWYDFIVSGHRSSFLRTQLRLHGGPRVLIVDAPWRLHER